MAPHTAKFIYDFWTHPETMRALCEAANEELIPFYDYEIGSTNVSDTLSSKVVSPRVKLTRSPSRSPVPSPCRQGARPVHQVPLRGPLRERWTRWRRQCTVVCLI